MIGAGAKILGNIEVLRRQDWRGFGSLAAGAAAYDCRWRAGANCWPPESDKPSLDMDQYFNGSLRGFEDGDGI